MTPQVSTVVANVGRELSLLKMAINVANADYLSFFLWNELEPRCLPERTRGRPWGRLRVRIRSIEKTWGWKFYPAAQNLTNRMLFLNIHIFKTI